MRSIAASAPTEPEACGPFFFFFFFAHWKLASLSRRGTTTVISPVIPCHIHLLPMAPQGQVESPQESAAVLEKHKISNGEYNYSSLLVPPAKPLERTSTPSLSETSEEEESMENQCFRSQLGLLRDRSNGLIEATATTTANEGMTDSPVTHACHVSVRSRMMELLKQASGFISSMEEAAVASDEDSSLKIHRLRCSIALLRAEQYLDLMERAMENPPRDELDAVLHEILESEKLEHVNDKSFGFRISPWVSSFLAFDLPVGPLVRWNAPTDHRPLSLQVEPMLEFNSIDLLDKNRESILSQVKGCDVVIEKCQHKSRNFSAGAGTIGECHLQVRLTPMSDEQSGNSSGGSKPIWGQDPDPPALSIREARA